MTEIIRRVNSSIQEWFYELGIKDNLSDNWELFKENLIRIYPKKQLKMKNGVTLLED
jgi:hypothetical protein